MSKEELQPIFTHPQLLKWVDTLTHHRSILLEGLPLAGKALLLSLLQKKSQSEIVIITHENHLDLFYQDLTFFLQGQTSLLEFPSLTHLSDQITKPESDLIGKRMHTLHTLLTNHKQGVKKNQTTIILTSLAALMQKLSSKETLQNQLEEIRVNQTVGFTPFIEKLHQLGYKRETLVSDKGEFAVRGGIIDLFPCYEQTPFRLEFFGETVEQIRSFDIGDQKSLRKVDSFFLSPAEERVEGNKNASLFDFISSKAVLFLDDLHKLEELFVALPYPPNSRKELFEKISLYSTIYATEEPIHELSEVTPIKKETDFEKIGFSMFHQEIEAVRLFPPFAKIEDLFPHKDLLWELEKEKSPTYFVFHSPKEESKVRTGFEKREAVYFLQGTLSSGLALHTPPLFLVPESSWSHKLPLRRQKQRATFHTPDYLFHSLGIGDTVVHSHAGIGKFLGIEKQKNHLGQETEYLKLQFANNSSLYTPLSDSHLVSRYIGMDEKRPELSQLGSKRWQTVKHRVEKEIVGYARQLLELYAEREIEKSAPLPEDSLEMLSFEKEFPYTETPDQLEAIIHIKKDLQKNRASDRLVCGDVGYGKTEVAMRAAAKTVLDGKKQVAVLVPTTVLAIQHGESFVDRMEGFPIQVAALHRFQKPSTVRNILQGVKEGTIDILIGTHRILSQDIEFNDLGLIIIDEEQRFGVKAKEHLRTLKKGVHCLTLSATPIPRTLYMSLVHAKDLSVINTPPQDRLPIQTIIAEMDDQLVKQALLRELHRNGQAYILHNRVESIHRRKGEILKLLPQARIGILHGQMASDEIDTTLHSFKKGDLDILLSTTIIENGVDVPRANTILIEKAHTYGLTDLYQLRGRVGRWDKSAFAYLLIPKHTKLEEEARKRLTALVENSGFGGGYRIAMRDLEIRGAGEILGTKQSGQISSVGFHLYCKLLKRTIEALKKRLDPSLIETKLEFPFDASLPETYIPETSLRIELYHRMGDAENLEKVDTLFKEIIDRFGPLPRAALYLYHVTRLRVFATLNGFILIKITALTLQAKQLQKGKLIEKTAPLPKNIQSPEVFEETIVSNLKRCFLCS